MSENRYGRLFTVQDVQRIYNTMAVCGLTHLGDAITKLDEGHIERLDGGGPITLTFPPDEPLFLLRAQDKALLSRWVNGNPLAVYFTRAGEAGASADYLAGVVKAMRDFVEWQDAHPERLKVPDTTSLEKAR